MFPLKNLARKGLIFSLICVLINGWVSNGGHYAHYDVIVMKIRIYGRPYAYHQHQNRGDFRHLYVRLTAFDKNLFI